MSSESDRTPFFSPRRVAILAGNTFTHLIRMKVFYFLFVFVLVAIAANFLKLPHTAGPESVGGVGAEELRLLKSPMVGVMKLFAVILGIVATALLIPRDLEDRTLYTILSKPVPRLDYLLGKLVGVLLLIFVGLAVMTVLLDAVLYYRTQGVMAEWMQTADILIEQGRWTAADKESARIELLTHGVTWSLQGAIIAIFLEAAIIASLALLVSTFSSSTLFTVVISSLCYFIGHFISDARDHWLKSSGVGDDQVLDVASRILIVIFPDFRPFKAVDEVVAGQALPAGVLGALAVSAALYLGIYVVLSWFVFSDKEI
ncbi:MAG: ABC transporter permease subunit [Akkermansiaceae bacterium]|nr:ABC transporter permease subunit [Akkermansiaceae bacterium]